MATIKKPNQYFSANTSIIAKKIGDSILIIGTTMSTISIENMPHWVTYTSVITTLAGKLITNFFEQPSQEGG